MQDIINKKIDVLDHGFIRVVDAMGNDDAIVQAARVSYGKGTKKASTDRDLIRFLLRNDHGTPFEMVEIKFHIKVPIFIARQWIRHRTANVNEYSGRYSEMEENFYIPSPEQLAAQSTKNHQGRSEEPLSEAEAQHVISTLKQDSSRCYDNYKMMMNKYDDGELINPEYEGVARELARINLPVNLYTQWYWKIDLRNLFNFMRLRSADNAQWEVQQYSKAIESIVNEWCPVAYEAFIDYVKGGCTLSRMGLDVVKRLLAGDAVDLNNCGMSKREVSEFRKKLDL